MVRARTATVNAEIMRISHPRAPIRFHGDRAAVPILQSIEGNVREACQAVGPRTAPALWIAVSAEGLAAGPSRRSLLTVGTLCRPLGCRGPHAATIDQADDDK